LNPTGPAEGEDKVVRGGGWDSNHRQVRTAYRLDLFMRPSVSYDFVGFRCVMDAAE
jgi:formylglycine-generating enzyme required for sulfatase activity